MINFISRKLRTWVARVLARVTPERGIGIGEGDPFATFVEWKSAADERAYKSL